MELDFPALKSKGQTSIEFILLVLFIIIYIATVVNPIIGETSNFAKEVARLGNAKISAEKLADAIDSIAMSPSQSRTTLKLLVPEKSEVGCDTANKKILFKSSMESTENPKACPAPGAKNCCEIISSAGTSILECNGEIALSIPAAKNLACSLDLDGKIIGSAMKSVTVENTDGEVSVRYA